MTMYVSESSRFYIIVFRMTSRLEQRMWNLFVGTYDHLLSHATL